MPLTQSKLAGLVLAVALLATGFAYAPALGFGFVDDDHSQVIENRRIRSWNEVPGYFTSSVWAHLSPDAGDLPPPYYRPLFLVWLFANYQLFGTHAAGWHLLLVLQHLLVTVLVYYLVRRIVGQPLPAAVAALLFGLHPVHVESVVWISGAPEPLMACAFLGSMVCYLKGRQQDSLPWSIASIVLFGVALLTKETAIMLPAVLFAYEVSVGMKTESDWTRCRRIAPYLLLSMMYFVVRQAYLAGTFTSAIPWSGMFLTWPRVLWNYLQHLLWPVDLTIVCGLQAVTHLDVWNVLASAAAIATLAAVAWVAARRRSVMGFATLWTILLMLPPLYLRGIAAEEVAHDRYLYLPSLGVCVIVALGITRFRAWRVAAVIGVLAAFGVYRESRPWSDDVSLFEHARRIVPDNVRAQRQLALALPGAGRCGDAIPLLNRLRERKEDPRVLLALGVCYYEQKNLDDAEPPIQRAISLAPRYQAPYILLIGLRLAQKRLADAEALWRRALSLQPEKIQTPGLHLLGGQILRAKGDLPGAAAEFKLELAEAPWSDQASRQLEEVEWTLRKGPRVGQ